MKLTQWTLTLIAVLAVSVPVLGQEVSVTATGYGGGAQATAIDEATQDAMRKAVEQGCGVFIQSKSVTKDFVLVKDQIISESKGFVTNHKVVSSKYDPNQQMATVTIQATVSKKLLISKWALYEASMNRIGKPKVMFVTALYHGKRMVRSKEAENNLRQPFVKARFFVVDAEAVAAKKKVDLQLAAAEGDMKALNQIGSEAGTDVIVRGKVTGELTGKYGSYGGTDPYYKYTFNYQFNIIRLSDSRTLHSFSDNFTTSVQSQSPSDAFRVGADKWSRTIGPHLRTELMKYWAFMGQNHITFHLEVRSIKFRPAKKLRQWLKEQKWVVNVWQDRFRQGIVVLRIESKISVETAMDKLDEQSAVPIEIQDNDKTHIRAKYGKEDED